MNLLSDVVAVVIGGLLLAIVFAYFTADPNVPVFCENSTTNPIDKTGCIIRTTVQSW